MNDIVDWSFVAWLFGGMLVVALVIHFGLAALRWFINRWPTVTYVPPTAPVAARDTSPDLLAPFATVEEPTLSSRPDFVDAVETPVLEVADCSECGRPIEGNHSMNWDASGGPMHLECMLVKHGSKGAA